MFVYIYRYKCTNSIPSIRGRSHFLSFVYLFLFRCIFLLISNIISTHKRIEFSHIYTYKHTQFETCISAFVSLIFPLSAFFPGRKIGGVYGTGSFIENIWTVGIEITERRPYSNWLHLFLNLVLDGLCSCANVYGTNAILI